jgi:hypothetical protein
MGMFDQLFYRDEEYQTKDTPSQGLDNYKIEQNQDDGHWYLWHEEYDAEWIKDDDGFLGGHMKQSNQRWVQCADFDGEIRFYRHALESRQESWQQDAWIEYKALFMDGRMIKIREIFDEPLTDWYKGGMKEKGLK